MICHVIKKRQGIRVVRRSVPNWVVSALHVKWTLCRAARGEAGWGNNC